MIIFMVGLLVSVPLVITLGYLPQEEMAAQQMQVQPLDGKDALKQVADFFSSYQKDLLLGGFQQEPLP